MTKLGRMIWAPKWGGALRSCAWWSCAASSACPWPPTGSSGGATDTLLLLLSSNTRLLSWSSAAFLNFISISTLLPAHRSWIHNLILLLVLWTGLGVSNDSPVFDVLLFQIDFDLNFFSCHWMQCVCWERTPYSDLLTLKPKLWNEPCGPQAENSIVRSTIPKNVF